MESNKIQPCWESEVKGILCLETETKYGFRKNKVDIRPSSCVWIDKEDFERLHEMILCKDIYNKQFQ